MQGNPLIVRQLQTFRPMADLRRNDVAIAKRKKNTIFVKGQRNTCTVIKRRTRTQRSSLVNTSGPRSSCQIPESKKKR